MLITREIERKIGQIIDAVVASYATYLIGRDLGQSVVRAVGSTVGAGEFGKLTFLEQSYYAGKVARILGTDRLKTLTEQELSNMVKNRSLSLTAADRATVDALRDDTERWLQGRSDAWQAKIRGEIASADRAWRAEISTSGSVEAAVARTTLRNAALLNVVDRAKDATAGFQADMDRLLQSEMNTYFQYGLVTETNAEEYVYKIPRETACEYCMWLHLNDDGSPKVYKLADVAGNTNAGLRAEEWDFTIGPVHPYCYCILYRVEDKRAPGANEDLAKARDQALNPTEETDTTKSLKCTCEPIETYPGLPVHAHKLMKVLKELNQPTR